MACSAPLQAFRRDDGQVVFREDARCVRALQLPCGQCTRCRLRRSWEWASRVMHEARSSDETCFVTLTYAPGRVPEHGSLRYVDFQLFMKRLRSRVGRPVRFFMCGEYGERNGRPHYHAALFGVDFHEDRKVWQKTKSGSLLYRSLLLESLWLHGFSSIGTLNFESAAYIARYVMKKVTGWRSEEHYRRVDESTGEIYTITPEFVRMSLKPGIGAKWYEEFGARAHAHDRIVMRGKESKVPRYYDKLLEREDALRLEELRFERELKARLHADDNTPERLAVKEAVAVGTLNFFSKRSADL